MSKARITVISSDKPHLDEVTRVLQSESTIGEVRGIQGGALELRNLKQSSDVPDVLIVNGNLPDAAGLDILESLGQTHPDTSFIVVSEDRSPEFLIRAMRAGVREVLPAPMNPVQLREAIGRLTRKRVAKDDADGKVLAFLSCKGGSGATFLAANLGYALATLKGKRVALVDLNLQFGDAALFVSEHKPQATIADVSQQIHRLDASFLASSMVEVAPGYSVLAAPEDPAQANDVQAEHIDMLIKLMRQHYDYILVDLGRNFDGVSIHALDQADLIFPVLQTTLPYIRDGKRLLGVFQSLDYRRDKIKLIVNRHEKNGDIKLRDVEQAFTGYEVRTVPNHYEAAAASVNQGVPILKLAKSSAISKALHEFADSLSGAQGAQGSTGWLSRMFQRA